MKLGRDRRKEGRKGRRMYGEGVRAGGREGRRSMPS